MSHRVINLDNKLFLKDNKKQKTITTINNSDNNILLNNNDITHKQINQKKIFIRNTNLHAYKAVELNNKSSQNNNLPTIFKKRIENIQKRRMNNKPNLINKTQIKNIINYSKTNINIYKHTNYYQLCFMNNNLLKVYHSKLNNTNNFISQHTSNNSGSLNKRKIYKSVLRK